MNDDIGNIPSAKLVEEWRRLRKTGKRNPLYWSNRHDKNLVASELDRRCEAAGMKIIDGALCVHPACTILGDGRFKSYRWFTTNGDQPIPALEFHALLGWLLMKGGPGK